MDNNEQSDAFMHELDNLISRFQSEFDLNIYTLAGILEAKKTELFIEVDVDFEEDMDINDEDIYE